jgi:hypothetical protein
MTVKRFSTKFLLCLVLLAMCQFGIVVLPVHGYALETTTWIADGGSYGRGSGLDSGDRWRVEWDILQGDGGLNVFIEDPDTVDLYTEMDSIGGSYVVTATTNGSYEVNFENPLDGLGSIQLHVKTENLGPAIPAFNLIITISLLGLLILFTYRKTKPLKI